MDKITVKCYNLFGGLKDMIHIYNGNIYDKSNFISNKYLKINSCGCQTISSNLTTIREKGRLDYHIVFVCDGMCNATYSGSEYTLKSGDFIIYPPNTYQKYTFDDKGKYLWIHFSGHAVDEILDEVKLSFGVHKALFPPTAAKASFETLINYYHGNRNSRLSYAFLKLLCNLSELEASSDFAQMPDSISKTISFINSNFEKKITLDELANISGYSKSRFINVFSKTTGITPIKFINKIRLSCAAELLASDNQSISETAFACGFDDSLYFSRAFKNAYGISPSEFKKRTN